MLTTLRPFLYLFILVLVGCNDPQHPPEEVTPAPVESKPNNDPAEVILKPYNSKEIFLNSYPASKSSYLIQSAHKQLHSLAQLPEAIRKQLKQSDKVYQFETNFQYNYRPLPLSKSGFHSLYIPSQDLFIIYGNSAFTEAFEAQYQASIPDSFRVISLQCSIYTHPLSETANPIWLESDLKSAVLVSQNELSTNNANSATLNWGKSNSFSATLSQVDDADYYAVSKGFISLHFPEKKVSIERSISCHLYPDIPLIMKVGQSATSHYLMVLEISLTDSSQSSQQSLSF